MGRTATVAAGAKAPAPLNKAAIAKAIASIENGLTDPYLRALWEAIAARKAVLEADGGLPTQHKVSAAESVLDVSPDPEPTPAVIDTPAPVFKSGPQARRRPRAKSSNLGHVSARPVAGGSHLQPVLPLTRAQWSQMETHMYFHHRGLAYSKADFKGQQVQGQTSSGDVVTFQISGVGDKSIKCLIVTEPPVASMSGKTSLHAKWAANEPVFMPHTLIEPWLTIPTDLHNYV